MKPTLTKYGGLTMAVGRPLVKSVGIRSDAVVHELDWEIPNDLCVRSIAVQCEALRLWFGDETASVETDAETQRTTAVFDTDGQSYETSAGKLDINLGYSSPRWPCKGTYQFNTSIEAILELRQPTPIIDMLHWVERIEKFFDVLAAFPPSDKRVRIWLEGHERSFPISFRNHLRGGASDKHPFNVFLGRPDNIDLAAAFGAYMERYDAIKNLQDTTRYLSSATLRVPEGFLTACNLVEYLGKDEALPNRSVIDAVIHLSELIEANPEYRNSWKTIDQSLLKHSSFAARFAAVAAQSKKLGCPVSLPPSKVRDVRARYRHDLKQLRQEDLIIMQAFVGFAWLSGLVELCRNMEIDDAIISQALSREIFHLQRGTNIPMWSKSWRSQATS